VSGPNVPRLARLAAKALEAEHTEGRGSLSSEGGRTRAIDAVGAAIREHARVRRRARCSAGIGVMAAIAAAAAAVAIVRSHGASLPGSGVAAVSPKSAPESTAGGGVTLRAGAVAQAVEGEVLVEGASGVAALSQGGSVMPGDRVIAHDNGRAALLLPTGTHLGVEPGGDLEVVDLGVVGGTNATQVFHLGAGTMRADVEKLRAGERFLVRTSDAEVEVRGTSFHVANVPPDPACGQGTTTRVTVFEGVVSVRAHGVEARVEAGQGWPTGCGVSSTRSATATAIATPAAIVQPQTPSEGSAGVLPARPPTEGSGGALLARPQSQPPPLLTPAAASDLAAQNDLFAEGIAAKNRGDAAAAVAAFERFLARYPESALAENAAVERMKLLGSTEAGRAAARDYLARYPAGFARSVADAMLAR
jgi:hypothetical protein